MTYNKNHAPEWQSRVLLWAGVAALAAMLTGEAAYALQSASQSQALVIEGVSIPTDAIIKVAIQLAAGVSVAFGVVLTAYLWRTGLKGLRKQACLAGAMTLVAAFIAIGGLSGYFAWTRALKANEVVVASEQYQTAVERRDGGQYLSRSDEAILREAEAPTDAERELGDIGKAVGAHILISGMFAAYRLPSQRKVQRKKSKAKKQPKDIRDKLRVA